MKKASLVSLYFSRHWRLVSANHAGLNRSNGVSEYSRFTNRNRDGDDAQFVVMRRRLAADRQSRTSS